MVHLWEKERWHNTVHQKRQMKLKEMVCIVKLGMQKQYHWICHNHCSYSNYETKESMCQSSSMLTTWHNILMILVVWALWQWLIVQNYNIGQQFANFSLIARVTVFRFEQQHLLVQAHCQVLDLLFITVWLFSRFWLPGEKSQEVML